LKERGGRKRERRKGNGAEKEVVKGKSKHGRTGQDRIGQDRTGV
jgi:hypothetical protein